MKICIAANSSRYIWNFRMNLAHALLELGHEVVTMSPNGEEVQTIRDLGIAHIDIALNPSGVNPLKELLTIIKMTSLFRKHSVDIVLTSTPKVNLYTAISNLFSKRKQIANVSGLGSGYLRQDWVSSVLNSLYKLVFKRVDYVFFENKDDLSEFSRLGFVEKSYCEAIPGLGVDLKHFYFHQLPTSSNNLISFIMISRLIGDKGVREYFEAARLVRQVHPNTLFLLLGDSNPNNPTCIPQDEFNRLINQGDVNHYEHTSDVRPYLQQAHCMVLPSYREGMSRTLLEAAAMGRPLIASNVPGCREAIDHGLNGFLCKPRNPSDLADQILTFLTLSRPEMEAMGIASRGKISNQFSETYVIQRYRHILSKFSI